MITPPPILDIPLFDTVADGSKSKLFDGELYEAQLVEKPAEEKKPVLLDIPIFGIVSLRDLRRLKKISQKKLAEQVGISLYKLREFERSNSTLKISKVNELLSILNQ